MSKPTTVEVSTHRLQEHEAVKAWRQTQPDCLEPDGIEILKYKRDSAVYRLNGIRPDGAAVIAKRCREATAQVERMIYEELLPRAPVPALRCCGFLKEPEGDFCWLFLEDAAGEMYSPQLAQHRALAGRWLGETHLATLSAELRARLPDRELGHYLQLLRGCRATLLDHLARNTALLEDDAVVLRGVAMHCNVLESHWNEMEKICEPVPRALVHGDFAVKNVRVQNGTTGDVLQVFDWQFAGWGVPGADLAQFVDHAASPDLEVYCSVLKREHPHLGLEDIQGVAACGNLLRLVHGIDWATTWLQFGPRRFLRKPVAWLRAYQLPLVEALNALRWN